MFFEILVWVCIVLAAIYLNFFFKRMFAFFSKEKPKVFYIVFIAIIISLIVTAYSNPLGTQTVIAGYFTAICGLFDIVGVIYRKWFKENKIAKYIYSGGLPAFLVTTILMTYGFLNGFNVVMTEYDINIDKEIKGGDVKIVYIADMHMGVSITMDNIEERCQAIEDSNPDIVLLGGDIFDERSTKEEIEEACKSLGEISSTYGTYFVWGNHEGDVEVIHGSMKQNVDFVEDTVEKNGMTIIEDESVLIDDRFYVVGRMDSDVGRNQISAEALMEGLDKKKPIIVLEHKPIDVDKMSELGADLYLCGHTHGGQLPPIGLAEEFMFDHVYGYDKVGNCNMIVTSGLGTWNTPIRIGSPSEFVMIELEGN